MITFQYNGKQYTTNNLENKLKKLGITKKDIITNNKDSEIIKVKKYYFKNKIDNSIIVSIYDNLDNLNVNENDYERIILEQY